MAYRCPRCRHPDRCCCCGRSRAVPRRDPTSHRMAARRNRSRQAAHALRGLDSHRRCASDRCTDRGELHSRPADGRPQRRPASSTTRRTSACSSAVLEPARPTSTTPRPAHRSPTISLRRKLIRSSTTTSSRRTRCTSPTPDSLRSTDYGSASTGELPAAFDVQTIPLSGDYVHVAVPPTTNNLNGIVATANGKWLIAVQSSTASLREDRPRDGRRQDDRAQRRRRDESLTGCCSRARPSTSSTSAPTALGSSTFRRTSGQAQSSGT